MTISDDVLIPSGDEVNVQEITVSSPVLRAIGPFMGKQCDEQCKEFMLCRAEEKDPRRCLKEGKAVTSCGLEFLYKVKEACRKEVEAYAKCLEWNSADFKPEYCREPQAASDYCMASKLGYERPPLGYFTSIRLHDTKRIKPKMWTPDFPGKPGELPEDRPLEPARNGSRFFGFW